MDSLHFSTTIIVLMLMLFFVLLFVSAFFSMSETSLFSINKTRLDFLIKQKNKRAISIYNIINEPDKLLSTILTGNNIVNTIVSTIGTTIAIFYLKEWGVILAPLIVAFILLIFSETFPKVLATQFPEQLSMWIVKPYEWTRWILSPIVTLITYITYLVFNLFGVKIEYKKMIFSREEVRHIIMESGETGVLVDGEHKLLHKVFEFNDKLAKEIMIPRNKIVAINADINPEDIIRIITEEGYSRNAGENMTDETTTAEAGLQSALSADVSLTSSGIQKGPGKERGAGLLSGKGGQAYFLGVGTGLQLVYKRFPGT